VLEPIRLHVDAKRCLCTLEPGYAETLSPASQASLALQGGRFSTRKRRLHAPAPCHAGLASAPPRRPGKVPDWVVPDLTHFETHLRRAAGRPA
jgi:predicted HD phosphohydrolase